MRVFREKLDVRRKRVVEGFKELFVGRQVQRNNQRREQI